MFQGLVASDAPELRPVLLHLVGEGALGPTERLGNTANIYAHVMENADRKNADILADVFLKKA